GAQILLHASHSVADAVENRQVLTPALVAFGGCRSMSEQTLEHDPRISLARKWHRRRGPGNRRGVDAAVAIATGTRNRSDVFNTQLHGRQRRVLPELSRVNLVHRDTSEDVRALGALWMAGRQEHG